jgi:Peptidase family M28/Domain of unknown function (DUF4214)
MADSAICYPQFGVGGTVGAAMRRVRGVVAAVVIAVAVAPVPAPAQVDPTVARMRNTVHNLAAPGPREAGTARESAAFDFVAADLSAIGVGTTRRPVPLPNGRTSANLSASFGDGPVRILFGAHVDTVPSSPGADDNASGVAVLLELARRLRNGTTRVPPGTAVELVWFGAEERLAGRPANDHHFGSRQHAAGLDAFGLLPHWMLSVDMIGYGPTPLAVWFDGADPTAANLLAAAASGAGVHTATSARGDISDHEAFARRGTAAAFLWRPDNPGYHGPGDTVVFDDRLVAGLRSVEAFLAAAGNPLVSARGTVLELYVDLLVRSADVPGAAWHSALLQSGQRSAGDIGGSMLTSSEFAAYVAPLARLYLAALGRLPEHLGLFYWSGVLRSGFPLEGIAGLVSESPEFQARYGSPDNRGFVRVLYRNVLHREPDAGGEQYWVDRLNEGRSRSWLVVAFAESAEHRNATAATLPVAVAYAGLLRREPDAGGLAWWSAQPVTSLVAGLVSSAEYRARFG